MPSPTSRLGDTSFSGMAFGDTFLAQLHIPEGEAIPHLHQRIAALPVAHHHGAAPADAATPSKAPKRDGHDPAGEAPP